MARGEPREQLMIRIAKADVIGLDTLAKRQGMSRNAFIAQMIRDRLAASPRPTRPVRTPPDFK